MTQTLFDMWRPFRGSLLQRHRFYVEQAKRRLLSQFENMSAEADQFGEEWLANQNGNFNPDTDDPSDCYEEAYDASIDFYQMLGDMQKSTRLSVAAGMFHEWDKQFRDWIGKEVWHWNQGSEVKKAIWTVKIEDLIDLFEGLGWAIRSKGYYVPLCRCRLVVNAYKHGDGVAMEELRKSHPEFLTKPWSFGEAMLKYANHDDLEIEEAHIDEFSNAIIEFWNDVPDRILYDEKLAVPEWLMKACAKDSKRKQETNA